MKLAIIPVTPFQQNCSLIVCPATHRAAFVDPGGEVDRLFEQLDKRGATLEKVLVTHGHIDHCGGVAEVAERAGVPIEGPHRDDGFWIEQLDMQGRMFGVPGARRFTPDRWLAGGDEVTVGAMRLEVRHCPGHTPGHVVFASTPFGVAFVGDVLFQGSIGRTDFPRGDHDTLIHSITTQLWPLGGEMRFVPGHGPMSTFGAERRSNPFVGDAVLGAPDQPR
ncbi:MAG: MBL fold metallo-hydrolase [Burkholderiales bacterium]|nr:MBL fold metallo-hydrolase [Burkholderiales bacterium]